MAFALAVGDVCAPAVFASLAASTEPPQLGTVTKISPTVVVWQDGREVTFTPSAGGAAPFDSVDLGLAKFVIDIAKTGGSGGVAFLNKKVRPKEGGSFGGFSNTDHRAEGVCVLAGNVTNAIFDGDPLPANHPVAVIRLNSTGLYVVLSQAEIEVIPGA
jgi:hypothetical protein